jgi:hypothetical protein
MTPEELHALNNMQDMLNSLTERLATVEAANVTLTQQLTVLTVPVSAPVLPESILEPKIAAPTAFDGTAKDLRSFLVQIELMFHVNASRFTSEESKIFTVASYLTDKALAWMTPILEKPNSFSDILQSWATFKAALKTTFGPVDQASISANAIRALKQGNRRVTAFAADFNLLASDLDFNEPALMHLFRHGLADNIKDMLLNVSEPTSMLEFITVATRADQRLVEHNRDRDNRGHSVTASNFLPKTKVTPTYPDSMDIDVKIVP